MSPSSLGTSKAITSSYPAKAMPNYCNFKPTIILEESPLIKDTKTAKFSAIPKGNGTNKNG